MDILNRRSNKQLVLILAEESAKSRNEMKSADKHIKAMNIELEEAAKDITKVKSRLSFILAAIYELQHRDIETKHEHKSKRKDSNS